MDPLLEATQQICVRNPLFKAIQQLWESLDKSLRDIMYGSIPRSDILIWYVRRVFAPLMLLTPDDFLTPEEERDVIQSLKEIEEGKGKKFTSIEEAIAWLKS